MLKFFITFMFILKEIKLIKTKGCLSMYLHLTSGTEDFLQKLKDKYLNESFILASNNQKSILFYKSSTKKSIFQMPQVYEVLEQSTKEAQKKVVSTHRFHLDKDNQSSIEFNLRKVYLEIGRVYQPTESFLLLEHKKKSIMILFVWEQELTYKQFQSSKLYESMTDLKKYYHSSEEAFFTPYLEQSYYIIE